MKLSIEVDCTPEEARRFLGLPDVSGLNERLVGEMGKRIEANISMLAPEDFLKTWMTIGAGAQEQFRKLMEAGLGGAAPRK